MTDSPIFRPSFGNRPDQIVGRDDVLHAYTDGLSSYPGSRDRTLLLLGQRGMGKTALLLQMADLALTAGFVPVRTTCGEAMLNNILDTLQHRGASYVAEKRPPVKGFSAGAFGFSFGLTFTEEARTSFGFRTKLEMLCDRLADVHRGVALLVDEVTPGLSSMRELATAYQELIGDNKNIALVMAGLPSVVSEILDEKTLTFLNRASKVHLGPIALGQVRSYYASAFARAHRSIDPETLDEVTQATEGFPYLLQLLGYYLLAYSTEETAISKESLAEAKKSAYADLDENVFRAMLRPLSNADIAFMEAMAKDDGPTRTGELAKRLGVSQGHVQSYRRRLLNAGVIVAPRRGEVAFVIPRLAEYLRAQG